MRKSQYRGILSVLCLAMALLIAVPSHAWADDLTADDGIGDTGTPLLSELGFSPSGAMADINTVTSGNYTPYGSNAFTFAGFDELFLQSTSYDGGSAKGWYNYAYVWDTLTNPASVNGNPSNNGLNIGSNMQDWSGGKNTTTAVGQQYSYCSSAALDADGDGRNNFVAQVYGTNASAGTLIRLRLINAESGVVSPSVTIVQTHSWVKQTQVGAFLSLAAGDYDGDGIDEIAAYDPSGPRVDFYEPVIADDGSLSLSKVDGKSLDIQELTGMNFGQAANVCSGADADSNFNELNELACVDLCTVSQSNESTDDLALAVSYSREAHARKWGTDIAKNDVGSRVATVTDPLTDNSKTQCTAMQWTWSSYGSTAGEAESNAETMMFAGLGMGDINNDGTNELVVGGYRLDDADLNDGSDTDISNDEYLVTYFSYALTDAATETGAYALVQKGQSISIDSDDYNDDTDLDDGFHSDGSSDVDDIYSPLSTTCFAAQGSSYADSVCLGGIVCRLGSQTAYGYGNYVMLSTNGRGSNYPKYAGTPSDKLSSTLQTQFGTTGFVAQYALQLKALDEKAFSASNNRLILDATAGNFDNNVDGREQLAFNYLVKQDGDYEFSTFVGIMNQGVSGDCPVKNYGSGSTRRIGDSSSKTDNVVMTCKQFADEDCPAMMTIAAVDIDHDSVIMRLEDKEPDFYFSNPKVISILEGDPVYGDILGDYENTEGGTSFTKSSGSGTTTTQEVSLTAGLIAGTTIGLDLIVTNVEVELEQTLSASAGYAYEKETSTTSSLSFTTHQQDQVGLVMTPYVRYYYQVWAKDTDGTWGWQEMTVDVPRAPQTSIILVDTYDRVARQYNDALDAASQNKAWTTIRGNIITNEVGDPASYPTDLPAETEYVKWQNIKGVSGSLGEGDFIGVGEGAGEVGRTLSYETATSNGITWGTSIERENKVTVRNAATVGYKWSIDYSGSYSWNSTKGVEYGWTVSSIPSAYFTDYNFRWLPIIGTAKLNAEGRSATQNDTCVVVGYAVRDVNQRLGAATLSVDSVTSNSVTLAWEPPTNRANILIGSYNVYRYNANSINSYYYIGNVSAASPLTFTDTNCSPETEYTYVVQAVAQSNGKKGIMSNKALATTNPTGDPVVSGAENQYVAPGSTATFAVSVTSGSTHPIQYKWQTCAAGETSWGDVAGATSEQLDVANVTTAQDGDRYRCVVTQMVGSTVRSVMSKVATLCVGDDDHIKVEKLKVSIEQTDWTVPMTTANTPETVKAWVEAQLATLNAVGATIDVVMADSFHAAAAGTFSVPAGTVGSFGFDCTLELNGATAAARVNTGRIIPTSYLAHPQVNVTSDRSGDVVVGDVVNLTAQAVDIASPKYQWFASADGLAVGGTAIVGATAAVLSPDTTTLGTSYFYCVATDVAGAQTTSNVEALNVVKATPVATLSVTPSGSASYGALVTLRAVVTGGHAPSGSVTFMDGTNVLYETNLTSGSASYEFNPGSANATFDFSVVYNGDACNNEARSAAIPYSTSKASQAQLSVTLSSDSITYGDTGVRALVSGGSGSGAIAYASTDITVATVDQNGAVTIVGVGDFAVIATKAGDVNYNDAQAKSQNATVGKKQLTITGLSATARPYDGTCAVTLEGGSLDGVVNNDVLVALMPSTGTVAAADAGTDKTVTFQDVKVTGAKSGNYSIAQPTVVADIEQVSLAVTVQKVVINKGQQLPTTLVTEVTGFVNGESASSLVGFSAPAAAASGTVDSTDDTLTSFPVAFSGGTATANYAFAFADTAPLQINCIEVKDGDYQSDKELAVLQTGLITLTPTGDYTSISNDISTKLASSALSTESGDALSVQAGEVTWSDKLVLSKEGVSTATFLLKMDDGTISEPRIVTYSIDNTPPAFEGIVDGGVYCERIAAKVIEANLASLTVNGTAVQPDSDNAFVIDGSFGALRIVATDQIGHVTTVNVTLYPNHQWGGGVVTTPPTTTSEGTKAYTCVHCGTTRTEGIAKLSAPTSAASNGSSGSITNASTGTTASGKSPATGDTSGLLTVVAAGIAAGACGLIVWGRKMRRSSRGGR